LCGSHFVREVTLLLNLGAVREGERVMYNGIPWLVRSLNFYTRLVNPELEGGDIRLPLRDFHDLRSRSFDANEPWFPTRLNDWVIPFTQLTLHMASSKNGKASVPMLTDTADDAL
jgi:hypothetical protein